MQHTLCSCFSHCCPSAPLTLPNICPFQKGTGYSRWRWQWNQYPHISGSNTQREGLWCVSRRLAADTNHVSRAAARAKNQSHLSQLWRRNQDYPGHLALTTPPTMLSAQVFWKTTEAESSRGQSANAAKWKAPYVSAINWQVVQGAIQPPL